MKRGPIPAILILSLLTGSATAADILEWKELPDRPPAPGKKTQHGLAGPFAGVSNGALIVAGGANFPDALPWKGGKKIWWDDIYVLVRDGESHKWITGSTFKLPRPLGYGVSITTEQGVVCIGGCDAEQCYAGCFEIRWDGKAPVIRHLPPLPVNLAFMGGARVGDMIYVAGGQGGIFLLGLLTKRISGNGAVVGLIASGAVQFYIWKFTSMHKAMYAFAGMAACIIVGYAASFVFRRKGNWK